MLKISGFTFLVAVLLFATTKTAWAYPENSLYNLPLKWKDANGKESALSESAGQPLILTMAYTGCKGACPITVERLRRVEEALAKDGLTARIALVSLDPAHDSPETLAHFKTSHAIDRANWSLLRGSEADTRKLSVLIGFSYKPDPETKEILHSNKLLLLDAQGEIAYSLEGLNADTADLVERYKKLAR